MSSGKVTNNSRSEIHDWNYQMNGLNDQNAERRFRRDGGFYGAEGSSPQRVNYGSRNFGYDDREELEVNNRRDFTMSDDMEQKYQRNGESRDAEYRGQSVERSRMYQIPDDEDRSIGHNSNQEIEGKNYKETESCKEMRDDRQQYQEMDGTGHKETVFCKDKSNDPNYYQEIDETVYRDSEFRQKTRDSPNHYQEMDETGYRETEFCNGKAIERNGRAYPENIEMGYMDRGLPHPETTLYYPAPNAQYIDRGSGIQQSNMQYQPGSAAWNTQVPFTVQYTPVGQQGSQEEKEEKKPRKRWWYTTSRVFSAVLIISSLVSDWLQYSDMDDPITYVKDKLSGKRVKIACSGELREDIKKQFLYFTITGTVLAALQLANIIYQIVQNHRVPIDTDITDYIDERTEVFLVNAFVKFPQTFLIYRYEENICLSVTCGLDRKKIKGILNGLSALASTVWRYLTHVKVSAGNSCSCSNICERCAARCGNCIKSCLLGCIKCLCPCCCCCIDCKTFIPCCCMHVICKNSHMSTKCVCQGGSKTCDPKSSSILAELAGFPTTLVAFLYGLRVWKYTCTISISSDVTTFVFETVIGYVWDKIFK
ncbi:uncharacterized protein LOC128189981 [Crassostrea angulata]|uniref:uncharacterized protein LOC128189981 n=1 Tax=Magallana angulata TaxID=2784310 RepID=UPI0022B1A2E4|nr:uncharacterized protein LOC128189981 [Crassostrea angulata]